MDDQRKNIVTEVSSARFSAAEKICHNPNCGFRTHEPLNKCPECKRPLWTSAQFRLISSPLILCGLFFIAVGGGLIYAVIRATGSDSPAGEEGGPIRLMLFGLFGLILALGLTVLTAGLWQVILGRASRWVVNILIGLMATLFIIVLAGRSVLRFFE